MPDDLTKDFNATEETPKHLASAARVAPLIKQLGTVGGLSDDEILVDLLTNLHHWAVEQSIDFDDVAFRAERHWANETPDAVVCVHCAEVVRVRDIDNGMGTVWIAVSDGTVYCDDNDQGPRHEPDMA